MTKIHKIACEIRNIALERGHPTVQPDSVKFSGRSSSSRGEHVIVVCDDCFRIAHGTTKPRQSQPDIHGALLKDFCDATPIRC